MSDKDYEPELGQMMFGNSFSRNNADWASSDLYEISEAVGKKNPDNQAHGLLGGEWGYGQEFENEVFAMKPYYWGDDEKEADKPNFLHKQSGLEIRWYKYIGRGMSANKERPKNWKKIVADCLESVEEQKG